VRVEVPGEVVRRESLPEGWVEVRGKVRRGGVW
jgi:hypothetical protein